MRRLCLQKRVSGCRLGSVSYQVFARKYRPRTFKDVLGQEHVVRTLCNAIEQKRLAHAYLFVGPRGTGKTSTARIFAKALNCSGGPRVDFDPDEDVCREIAEGRSLDVMEIDGASNRGIDNIRDLRENVQITPTHGQYRIIYIDEVHMLTKESFNALLKTLEEPPEHVMFIFATTEPHKILPTILSRCQRFDLRPIPADIIAKHLIHIASSEGVTLNEDAAYAIAAVADGGMRDAQSMLDQLVAFCGNCISERHVNDVFGVTGRDIVARAVAYMLDRQLPSLLHLVHELSEAGRDMKQFLEEMMGTVRELMVAKVAPQESCVSIPSVWREPLMQHITRIPLDKIVSMMDALSGAEEQMRWSTNRRLHLELGIIQAVHSLAQANISDIIKALNGAPVPDTPIATEILPDIPLPAAGEISPPAAQPTEPREVTVPQDIDTEAVQPAPAAEANEAVAESEEQPPVDIPEPIDDAPPSFSNEPVGAAAVALNGEIWEKALAATRARAPLKAGIIGNTLYVGEDAGLVTIAIHPKDIISRDALLNDDVVKIVREILEGDCGYQLDRIRVVADTQVPEPAEEHPESPTRPDVVQVEKKGAVAGTKEETTSRVPKEARHALPEDEFYKDPLIEQALKEFEAKIVKQQ